MKKFVDFLILFLFFLSFQISAQTWSGLTRLTWNTEGSFLPSITADSGNGIHITWSDYSFNSNEEILYIRSVDRGTTWLGLVRLTWNAGSSWNPSIASDLSGCIHIVWEDNTQGNWEIYYERSTDNGVTWSDINRLTWNPGWSCLSSIAADSSSGIHMVWQDDNWGNGEILYKRSMDGGVNWSDLTRVTWNFGWSDAPDIATDSGSGIHVVWYDDNWGNHEICYKRSSDKGATWAALTRLTWNSGNSSFPAVAADSGSGIHVVWRDDTPGNTEIFYKKSSDGGTTWSGLKRLTWKAGNSIWADISADESSSEVYVVWTESATDNSEVFYMRSTDSGNTWSGAKRLSWNTGRSEAPSVAADNSNGVHVAWSDSTPGNAEIYYKNRK